MDKYQEALDELKSLVHSELDGTRMLDEHLKHCDTLQELVNKATPKKVKEPKLLNGHKNTFIDGYCPNCKEHNFRCNKYCMHCGQALDWSDEDDK